MCDTPFINLVPSVLPGSVPNHQENKWIVMVDRVGLLTVQVLSGLFRLQELCWRLLELHNLKIVSTGIIWVALQEVGLFDLCMYAKVISENWIVILMCLVGL